MLPVVSASQMRAIEREAFAAGFSADEAMNCAAQAVFDQIAVRLSYLPGRRLLFVCGTGNNAGDGLEAALLCHQAGAQVLVKALPAERSPLAQKRFDKLIENKVPHSVGGNDLFSDAQEGYDLVVDALMGIGLSRPPEGLMADWIVQINAQTAPVLSVDIPSGLHPDKGAVFSPCIRAAQTVALGCLKRGLFMPSAWPFVGQIVFKECGLAPRDAQPYAKAMTPDDLPALLPVRLPWAHKGDNGRVLVYAGSLGFAGAAIMAARAALRAGAGLVTLLCDDSLMPILQTAVPQAMCLPVAEALAACPPHDVLLMGCGLARNSQTDDAMRHLYQKAGRCVLDAEALNSLAKMGDWPLRPDTILTPHPAEAARLLGCETADVLADPEEAARQLHQRFGTTVLLKGAISIAHDGAGTLYNPLFAPALAKGGSGDILAGLLAGLWAQAPAASGTDMAALASLWLCLAARQAANSINARSVVAEDILDALGAVLPLDKVDGLVATETP